MAMASLFTGLRSLACLVLAMGFLAGVMAFDNSRKDNLAVYWGQDGAGSQQRLSFYCQDDTVDVIPLAFLYIFRGTGGEPVIDFANTCNQWDDSVFPGTALANCQAAMEADIKLCQSKGKLVTLSLGGATGQVGFSSDSQAQSFATQVWNLFLGGSSSTRPFGSAVLDGIDLDIESGTPAHYPAFVNQLRSLSSSSGKKVYITAAPQCVFPDAFIGSALNQASFDAVYVQFYNNDCGVAFPNAYNFATWDKWAKNTSFNKNIKVYIGVPGSADAGGGYVSASKVAQFAADAQSKYSSFGGVMMWDADTAYTNGRFDKAVKSAIVKSAAQIAPQVGKSSSAHAPSTVKASTASAHAPSTVKATSSAPAPKESSATFSKPTATVTATPDAPSPTQSLVFRPFSPHQTEDAVASADRERFEKTASADKSFFTPSTTGAAKRSNSRLFRL